MLLTPRGGPRCLAPTAHRVPVYPMVSITFLCRACTAQPCPPLDPYVRLSPHTAHERVDIYGMCPFHQLHQIFFCGQLARSLGYLCTASLPLSLRSSAMCVASYVQTTMTNLTACRALEFRIGSPLATSHPPFHPSQALPCSICKTQSR